MAVVDRSGVRTMGKAFRTRVAHGRFHGSLGNFFKLLPPPLPPPPPLLVLEGEDAKKGRV